MLSPPSIRGLSLALDSSLPTTWKPQVVWPPRSPLSMNKHSPSSVATPGRPSRQGQPEFLALMAAASATIAISIDAMLPAFGALRGYLGLASDSSAVALVVTVFMAGIGVGQLIYGPLADRFGRKPVFLAGLVIYTAAGLIATFATNLGGLLVARFFWGLGAAGPRVVAHAMLRDRLRGDALARAMAIILTIFMIVPTLAPMIGQAILQLGSWRYTFAVGPIFGLLVMTWTTRLEETLDPANQRSIELRPLVQAVKEILSTRRTLGHTIALLALNASFLPYLASSERMYGEIYERPDEFFLWFAAASVVMAGFTLMSAWNVRRVGSRAAALTTITVLLGFAAAYVLLCLGTAGVPPFALFVVGTMLLMALNTALTPVLTSSALDEVGHVAGTAASVIGAIGYIGGALISPLIDSRITSTITPFAVGLLILGGLAGASVFWAERNTSPR